jgi:hypothetical protein
LVRPTVDFGGDRAQDRPVRARLLLAIAVLLTLVGLAPARPAAAFACGDADQRVQFVCTTYTAMAGREASTADLDYWVPKLPAQRTFFVATVARSGEGRRLVTQVYYSRFYETAPTESALVYWSGEMLKPNALRRLEAALLADNSLSAEDFVERSFDAQLGREPAGAELTYWAGRVTAEGKNKVAALISNTLEARRARVGGVYINDLGFLPDEASRAYWAERLRTGTSYLDVRIAIRSSPDAYPDARTCTGAAAPQPFDVCSL